MFKEAIEEFEKAVSLAGSIPWPSFILTNTYFESGENDKGEKLFKVLEERSKHEYVPPLGFFYIHLARGDLDQAYTWFERGCKERDSFLPWCNIIPIEEFRIPFEPRFQFLLKAAGLRK